jgi:hypothetical protein
MSQETKDLRNAAFYLAALVLLAGGLVVGGILLAQRVDAGAAVDKIISVFSQDDDDPDAPTRLSIAVESAREIRAALERPIAGPSPLPPITAQVAHGHFKPGRHAASGAASRPLKLPKAALDAMASAEPPSAPSPSRSSLPRVELHRIY